MKGTGNLELISVRTRTTVLALLSWVFALQGPPAAGAEPTELEMKRGRIMFLQCRACHSLTPKDNEGKVGPSLAGVFGRAAGSADFFENYSAALRESGHEWNPETMSQWLEDPAKMVPGTTMVFAGISDEKQRNLMVRYLEAVTQPPPDAADGTMDLRPPSTTVCTKPSAGTISFDDIRQKYTDPDSRFVTLEGLDGINIHYKDQGKGPAVLLIHSTFGDLKDYDTWVDTLSSDYRVIRLDLPAFGLTGAVPSGNYSVERYLTLVDALMDHLGIEKFGIAGTSYGGLVAFRYAATRTDRVTTLILQNSAGIEYGGRRGTEERARNYEATFEPRVAIESDLRKMLNSLINDPSKVTPELVSRKADYANVIGRDCESFVATRFYERGNPERVLGHVRAPALVMWGGDSNGLSPSTADAFAEALVNAPSVDKVVYEGGGHLTHIGRPAETANDVKKFLDRTLAR